jgi:hypothetical protein
MMSYVNYVVKKEIRGRREIGGGRGKMGKWKKEIE